MHTHPGKKRQEFYPDPRGDQKSEIPHKASGTVHWERLLPRPHREPEESGDPHVGLSAFPGLSLPPEHPRVCSHSGGYDLFSAIPVSTEQPDI